MGPKWSYSTATSTVHKALRRGDVEMAAFAAAYLCRHGEQHRAWRRVLAFPSEDFGGVGAEKVAALYTLWEGGHEDDNLFMAILYLCRLVQENDGVLNREGDELKNAALVWAAEKKIPHPPDYALDHHTGHARDPRKWWSQVNDLGPASPWREDAMRLTKDMTKASRRTDNQKKLL